MATMQATMKLTPTFAAAFRALLVLTWLALGPPAPAAATATKNILLVIADDFGIDSHSLSNTNPAASLPPTPTLDTLAARGVRFANACAQPTCSPTRAAILTGRYGFRTGITTVLDSPGTQGVYTNEFTLPELLTATHRCGSVGKWHLGGAAAAPNAIGGWAHFSGSLQGGLGQNATNFYTWTKTSNGVTRMNHSGYATTDNVNDALTWLAAQGTNRWFLWLAFNAPHTPYHKPPTSLCPHYTGLSGTATDIQQNPRSYFEAAVEAMDTELGRLLAGIDTNETTVFFVGDNGTPGRVLQPPFNAPRGKDSLYEGGVRVPFIAAGPDIANPGRVSDAVVHVVDLFATILELAGLDPASVLPRSLPNDSRSLMPILRDEPFAPAEETVLMENSDTTAPNALPGRAARRGEYKLIQFNTGVEEFYHLASDPLEATNLLAGTLTGLQQANLNALRARLVAWTNVPVIYSQSLEGGVFSVEAGWFAGHEFSLWRNPDLATTNWTRLTNATTQNLGASVRLSDLQPPAGQAFYHVRQE
jgi:arylsulfatase A-like enzyme